jgi:flagellar biosynthesis/type III secretory pathway M-ring protein FliF/YscJ
LSTSSSISSAGGSFSPTASASQTAVADAAPSSPGLETGAKAGIGSGVAVVVILLVVIAFLVKKLIKKRQGVEKKTVETQQPDDEEKAYMAPHVYPTEPVEMLVENVPVEIDNKYVAELPGSYGFQKKSAI